MVKRVNEHVYRVYVDNAVVEVDAAGPIDNLIDLAKLLQESCQLTIDEIKRTTLS